ncbi:MAG: agmatine deiminase family protein [Polyangiales bacterium]
MRGRLRIPAEWERHACVWLAFPHVGAEWPSGLTGPQRSIAELARTIAEVGAEPVRLLVTDGAHEDRARRWVGEVDGVEYVTAQYGDCWTRDTLPLFGVTDEGELGAARFQFNGWGGKFPIPGDDTVGRDVAMRADAVDRPIAMCLEGGALDFNGDGICLTTRSCLLNSNRNPGLTERQAAEALRTTFEADSIIWLTRGLEHDHTDGHVDNVARFINADTVAVTEAPPGGPNLETLQRVMRELEDAGLRVFPLPSPGRILADDGSPLPATYCNFYVANDAVIFPSYGVAQDEEAAARLRDAFPNRTVVGLSAKGLLSGGGAIHCVTQPQPWLP